MNIKQTIQIAVIVVAFGAAAFILYSGGFSPSSAPSAAVPAAVSKQQQEDILPNGDSLDFQVINPSRFEYDVIQYPRLDPANEVGIQQENLVTSVPGE